MDLNSLFLVEQLDSEVIHLKKENNSLITEF